MVVIAIGYVGFSTYERDGLPFRAKAKTYKEYLDTATTTSVKELGCTDKTNAHEIEENWFCIIGSANLKPALFVFGDSHAAALYPYFMKLADEKNIKILMASFSGCPAILGINSMRWDDQIRNCKRLNERIYSYVVSNKIPSVALISHWSYYSSSIIHPEEFNAILLDSQLNNHENATKENSRKAFEIGLIDTIARFKENGIKVVLFEDNPTQFFTPKDALRNIFRKYENFSDDHVNLLSISKDEHLNNEAYNRGVFNKIRGIDRVNFDDVLCNENFCPLIIDGNFIYSDNNHLSNSGVTRILKIISNVF